MSGDSQTPVSITTFFSIPCVYQSRQLSWMICDYKICASYLRFYNWIKCSNYEKFGINKVRYFWSDKYVFKSCCFLVIHLSRMQTFPKNCLYMWQVVSPESFGYQLQIIKSIFYSIFWGRRKSPILFSFYYDLSICCFAHDILSWKFADLWQSFRPMLGSIYLGKFKSAMKVWIFCFGSICPLRLDFTPLLFAVVHFLVKTTYGIHCISHLIFHKIMFLQLFFLWIDFLSMLHMFYIRNVKVFSIFFF